MFQLTELIFISILLICKNTFSEKKEVTIITTLGDVIGKQMNEYVSFKGIPYTEYAPVGDGRFTESVVRTSDFPNNPYLALNYSPICIQDLDTPS